MQPTKKKVKPKGKGKSKPKGKPRGAIAGRKGPIPARAFTVAGKYVPSLGVIARGTGLSRDGVSRIFNGQRRPTLDTATRIAGYIGVSVEQLSGFLHGLDSVKEGGTEDGGLKAIRGNDVVRTRVAVHEVGKSKR